MFLPPAPVNTHLKDSREAHALMLGGLAEVECAGDVSGAAIVLAACHTCQLSVLCQDTACAARAGRPFWTARLCRQVVNAEFPSSHRCYTSIHSFRADVDIGACICSADPAAPLACILIMMPTAIYQEQLGRRNGATCLGLCSAVDDGAVAFF